MCNSSVCVKDNLLLYIGADRSLVVWDTESREELGRLTGHDNQIGVVAAAGNLAVSAQQVDGVVRLWNLEALRCTAVLPDASVCFSACCTEGRVLLGSDEGLIEVWDIAASTPVALPALEGHTNVAWSIKASGSMVLSGSHDDTVRLWDLRTGSRCVRTMEGHSHGVVSVDMDESCRTAVSGSGDTTVRLWDLGSGRCSATMEGHSSSLQDVVMHESGSRFLSSGGDDGTVKAWAIGSSEACMRADMKAYSLPGIWGTRLFASRDLSRVAYCCLYYNTQKLELRVWK